MYEPIVANTVNIFMEQLHLACARQDSLINLAPRVHLFAMDTCMV